MVNLLLASKTFVSEIRRAAVTLSKGSQEDEASGLVLLTCSPVPLWAACALEESTLSRGHWFLSAD